MTADKIYVDASQPSTLRHAGGSVECPTLVAFITYALLLDLPPVLVLHVILLPLNGWRLMGVLKQRNAMEVGQPSVPLRPVPDFIVD